MDVSLCPAERVGDRPVLLRQGAWCLVEGRENPARPGAYPNLDGNASIYIDNDGRLARSALDVFYSLPFEFTQRCNWFLEAAAARGWELEGAARYALSSLGMTYWGTAWTVPAEDDLERDFVAEFVGTDEWCEMELAGMWVG